MKAVFASIALFAAGALAQTTLTINTPSNVVECEPTMFTWSGGEPPYTLSIVPGSSPDSTALETFSATSATSLTWTVNIASGTSIGLNLRDSTGLIAQSASFTILAGTSTTCTNTTSVVPGTTATGGASATTAAATTTGASASAGTTAVSSASSSGSASSSTSTSGASANVAQFGAAGVVGAAVAALFL